MSAALSTLMMPAVASLVVLGPASAAQASDCTRTHSGRVPLVDLGTGTYLGAQGGLYPGGANSRPAAHDSAGRSIATNQILPRNSSGAVDNTNGKVVFASIGMSNTTQEFQAFMQSVAGDATLNPKLVLVDGAQGGQAATAWADPNSTTWQVLNNRLMQAGVTPAQVQTVWLKQQFGGDNLGTFPSGAQQLRDALRSIVTIAKSKYPNLRIVHLSSRTYGDYSTALRGKGAYEQAFAVKQLIEDQIAGDPRLAYAGTSAPAPWLAWGPYLWADGLGADGVPGGVPGRRDGLEWTCADYQTDGVHPSTSGRNKVARALVEFYRNDTTAAPWFRAS
ncbi:hypothetical protein [Actinomadura alba]|uniref:SGNH/GDSL hydrolase family protein n=1 Tax=Actinomadura alba TaxID=406431 RepID=A0ABR7M2S7_9ACTN|nr:hypothetical protein [Actinomadura alba]